MMIKTGVFVGLLVVCLLITGPQRCDASMVEELAGMAADAVRFKGLQVSSEQLKYHIRTAFSRPRSYNHTAQTDYVVDYIHNFFNNLTRRCPSAQVEIQHLDCVHMKYGTGQPGEMNVAGVCLNIFLVQRGVYWGTSRDQIVLVGAHYDSQLNTPGVNDNGGGMAALLETARVVVGDQCQRDHTIMYVAFDMEEFGYVGSYLFVNQYLVPEVLYRYNVEFDGAIILDTLMNFNNQLNSQIAPPGAAEVFPDLYKLMKENQFRGNFLAMIGREDDVELLDNMSAALSYIQGSDKFLHTSIDLPLSGKPLAAEISALGHFMRSDHQNFWSAENTLYGLPAIQLSDTANFRKPMTSCYHQPCDDLRMMTDDNVAFLAKTTQAIVYTVTKMDVDTSGAKTLGVSVILITTSLLWNQS